MTLTAILPDESTSNYIADLFTREPNDSHVIIAHGFGVKIRILNGQLTIEDGIGRNRRTRQIPKIDRTIKRIIVTSQDGYISLEVLQWCADHGISIASINPNAELVSSFTAESERIPSVLRQQVHASESAKALDIVCEIETRKLSGQSRNVRDLFNDLNAYAKISQHLDSLASCESVRDMRDFAEAQSARTYFAAWSGRVCIEWDSKSISRVPANWLGSFTGRTTQTARGSHRQNASDPVNAILNYAYTLGYNESRIACISYGLDSRIGYLHDDKPGRDSLALDILEVLRPIIDDYVISLVRSREWSYRCFAEPYGMVPGTCRLVAPLTHEIAEASYSWHKPASDMAKFILSVLTGRDGRRGDNAHLQLKEKLEFTSAPVTVEDILPDKQWNEIRPLIPVRPRARVSGKPPVSDRRIVAAMLHCERHGKPWAYVPDSLGMGQRALQNRRSLWRESGHWDSIQGKIRELAES